MERLRLKLGAPANWAPPARVIYDAEAISTFREAGRRRLAGERLEETEIERMVDGEVELMRGAAVIIAVSEQERLAFRARSEVPVHVASFAVATRQTPASFTERRGFLFVGSFDELSPNGDAVQWFTDRVLPLVQNRLRDEIHLVVVGRHAPTAIRNLQSVGVEIFQDVYDLTPFYDQARVFVAPTRFAAGLPYKVAHAAAHGVPVVCTRLLQTQLGWLPDVEVLAADTPESFAEACTELYDNHARWTAIRSAALLRVNADFSRDGFRSAIRAALTSCTAHGAMGTDLDDHPDGLQDAVPRQCGRVPLGTLQADCNVPGAVGRVLICVRDRSRLQVEFDHRLVLV
jgi:glycosyltransferase involved in cell wall biosynthesis